jgi:hypothetical protein
LIVNGTRETGVPGRVVNVVPDLNIADGCIGESRGERQKGEIRIDDPQLAVDNAIDCTEIGFEQGAEVAHGDLLKASPTMRLSGVVKVTINSQL